MTEPKKYVFPAGSPVPLPVILFGYLLIVLGIGFMGELPYLDFGMIALGVYVGFQGQGAEISMFSKKIRVYNSYLGLRFGKWYNLEDFPFITVLKTKTSERVFGMSANFVQVNKAFYSVCILSKSHHTRIVIKNFEKEEDAFDKARELSESLDLTYSEYNPVLSKSSQLKRNRRR
jgi:hypothetical protein